MIVTFFNKHYKKTLDSDNLLMAVDSTALHIGYCTVVKADKYVVVVSVTDLR